MALELGHSQAKKKKKEEVEGRREEGRPKSHSLT